MPLLGGARALEAIGHPPTMPDAFALIEMVRRLHFYSDDVPARQLALTDLALATADLLRLQQAIAAGTVPGEPLALSSARAPRARRRLATALEAAGLELREVKRQFVVREDGGDEAARLRARLRLLGVDLADVQKRLASGEALTATVESRRVPLPLAPQTWSRAIFQRPVTVDQLFIAIATDEAARLLYHGLMALDGDTRRWLGSQDRVLKQLYGDGAAVRTFAMFAAALRVRDGQVVVPGGAAAAARWSAALGTEPARADRFVRRLFSDDSGRAAGLYFTAANAEAARLQFIMGPPGGSAAGFDRLVSSFTACYAADLPLYPFNMRANDPATLLLEADVTADGTFKGPVWRRFWARALEGDRLPDDPARELRDLQENGRVDPAWLIEAVCGADPEWRGRVFETLLFANRVFATATDQELPDALLAVRARRLYPAPMMALEQAGITSPRVFAHVARHSERLGSIEDPPKALVLLQQFQGALAITLQAFRAGTISADVAGRLLESLSGLALDDGRYQGRMARWFAREWLPAALGGGAAPAVTGSPEAIVVAALSGVPARRASRIRWEGLDYTLDMPGYRRQLLERARKRQGGVSLDDVMSFAGVIDELAQKTLALEQVPVLRARLERLAPALIAQAPAQELLNDVPNVRDRLEDSIRDLARVDGARRLSRAADVVERLTPVLDHLLGHALASWAYAPFLGDDGDGSFASGDPALQHQFGVREIGRFRAERRWEIAWRGDVNGVVSGALLGVDVALARRSLRRIASDALPEEPTISISDLRGLLTTVALSDVDRVTDAGRDAIAAALAAGASDVASAGRDRARLEAVADKAGLSPWQRQTLAWAITQDASIDGWFTPAQLAAAGGVTPPDVEAWGTASLVSGCLCPRMPRARVPETALGRPSAGVPAQLASDLMLRIAAVLAEHRLPAQLAPLVLRYAMREFIDRVRPLHIADLAAFVAAARAIDRARIEDYIGAVAADGPLRPVETTEN